MWQKVELKGEETVQENERAEAINELVKLGGIQAVMEQVDALPDAPKKERKPRAKNTIISSDPVNHPAHYTTGGIETIDFIEAKGLDYNLGNVVKYICRWRTKNGVVDLEKALGRVTTQRGPLVAGIRDG